jgi:hypothetical protein
MGTPLLSLPVRGRRDILLARQRARQLAGLLGYDAATRLGVAAAAFEVAWGAYPARGRSTVVFQIEEGLLQIFAAGTADERRGVSPPWHSRQTPRSMDPRGVRRLRNRVLQLPAVRAMPEARFEIPLPAAPAMSADDAAWAVRELDRQTPLNLFEEVRRQNEELLRLVQELGACPAHSDRERRPAA